MENIEITWEKAKGKNMEKAVRCVCGTAPTPPALPEAQKMGENMEKHRKNHSGEQECHTEHTGDPQAQRIGVGVPR